MRKLTWFNEVFLRPLGGGNRDHSSVVGRVEEKGQLKHPPIESTCRITFYSRPCTLSTPRAFPGDERLPSGIPRRGHPSMHRAVSP